MSMQTIHAYGQCVHCGFCCAALQRDLGPVLEVMCCGCAKVFLVARETVSA
jgi:hypothetical protein